jgi:hypothetical protein
MRTTGLGLGTIATEDEATAAQIQAGTASKAVAADKLVAAAAPQTLTDGATVAWDLSRGLQRQGDDRGQPHARPLATLQQA